VDLLFRNVAFVPEVKALERLLQLSEFCLVNKSKAGLFQSKRKVSFFFCLNILVCWYDLALLKVTLLIKWILLFFFESFLNLMSQGWLSA